MRVIQRILLQLKKLKVWLLIVNQIILFVVLRPPLVELDYPVKVEWYAAPFCLKATMVPAIFIVHERYR